MGVSGTGKTTIGQGLAEQLALPFIEGDEYHPRENVAKMAAGKPLNDSDRAPWLAELGQVLAKASTKDGCVLACSALKERYRNTLQGATAEAVHFVWLHGEKELLKGRLKQRAGHFFPMDLLDSQFEALEPPINAIELDVAKRPETLIAEALRQLR